MRIRGLFLEKIKCQRREPLMNPRDFRALRWRPLQMEPRVGYKAETLKVSLRSIKEASGAGAKIAVVPELVSRNYGVWSPEVYRLLAMQGADIVCMPTN